MIPFFSKHLSGLRDDRGITLPELMVSIMLLTIVGIVFSNVLASTLSATNSLEGAARDNDEIRLTIERIDRELRGAEQICLPEPGDSGNELVFITRTSSDPAIGARQIHYELGDVDGDGVETDLMRSEDAGVTWTPVGNFIVNLAQAAELGTDEFLFANQGRNEVNETGTPVASPSFGKVISLRIWIDTSAGDRISPRLETTEVSGRNVWNPNAASC